MSETFRRILHLVQNGEVLMSDYGYDEIVQENIFVRDIIDDIVNGIIVEDYPEYPKEPCVLVLQKDKKGKPIHVVWGIPRGKSSPAVVVTAYRPDPARWTSDFMRRKV